MNRSKEVLKLMEQKQPRVYPSSSSYRSSHSLKKKISKPCVWKLHIVQDVKGSQLGAFCP